MKKIKKIVTFIVFVSLFSFPNFSILKSKAENCSLKATLNSSHESQNLGTGNNICVRKYILGPNDVINISFIGFPEFKQENVRVQPDGNILMAPVGITKAQGKTLDELQYELKNKFAVLIKNPMISISLVKTKPLIVYLTGAIMSPGSYELNTDTSYSNSYTSEQKTAAIERKTPLLTNILGAAGGITPDADLENVEVSNKYDGSKYTVNLLDLINKGNSSQDIYLMSGDTIYVPRLATTYAVDSQKYNSFASSTFSQKQIQVRVMGYVNNAGLVILNTNETPRLNTAISLAGGYLAGTTAPPKNVIISRMDNNGKLSSAKVNPMINDIVLMPNDVIFVPEKTSSSIARGFDYLLRVISPVSSFAGGYSNMDYVFRR